LGNGATFDCRRPADGTVGGMKIAAEMGLDPSEAALHDSVGWVAYTRDLTAIAITTYAGKP
jgi:hypothetical protein